MATRHSTEYHVRSRWATSDCARTGRRAARPAAGVPQTPYRSEKYNPQPDTQHRRRSRLRLRRHPRRDGPLLPGARPSPRWPGDTPLHRLLRARVMTRLLRMRDMLCILPGHFGERLTAPISVSKYTGMTTAVAAQFTSHHSDGLQCRGYSRRGCQLQQMP
ncbi:hypothetical protein CONLIGDRAFT_472674 [Coniochaeta ligniaria NRRL 30616]|uniref:Uncharacterized protein n=1 Tax=Coniochaeta ligniaria NRRL 30616 TaxID=1408157 RepID=A0A1J7IGN9_9PEZI|nr:hypothetical protein CONLIGDRAFT_472674 [Coniochaeta ligniaria NRRL 30616]